MKHIKVAKAIMMAMTIIFIVYNTYYGWNWHPESELESRMDNALTLISYIALMIYIWPMVKRYESNVSSDWKNNQPVVVVKQNFAFKELYQQHKEFSDKTFGPNRTPHGPLKHMQREVVEALENPSDESEYADILLLLIDAHRNSGGSADSLMSAAFKKLEVNKNRKWNKPDADGVSTHVKD